jgi:cytochrome P450
VTREAVSPVVNSPFDPWDEGHRPDPKPFYAEMRESLPVYRGIGPVTRRSFWFLTRYDDVVEALRNPVLGREVAKLPDGIREQHEFEGDEDFELLNRHLLNLDPPDHTRLRKLVSHASTTKRIRDLEPRIQSLTESLLDELTDGDDLIEKLALPVPVTVIVELLGVAIEDQARFRDMVDRSLRGESEEEIRAAGFELIAYVNDAIDFRRTSPGDDLLSALIHLEEDGDRLDRPELIAMVQLLLIAGHETTVNLIGNGTVELLRHPDQKERLIDDPGLLSSAIEEGLRFNGPVETTFPRVAFESTEIGGERILQGDMVIPVLMAANSDPEQFPEPDRFDISRDPNRHVVAFGSGIHYCLGAPLARLEARVVFASLLGRLPGIDFANDPADLHWTSGFFLRGCEAAPGLNLSPTPQHYSRAR